MKYELCITAKIIKSIKRIRYVIIGSSLSKDAFSDRRNISSEVPYEDREEAILTAWKSSGVDIERYYMVYELIGSKTTQRVAMFYRDEQLE